MPPVINMRPNITSDALLRVGLSGAKAPTHTANIGITAVGGGGATGGGAVGGGGAVSGAGAVGGGGASNSPVSDKHLQASLENEETLESKKKSDDWRSTLITMSIVVLIIVVILILMYFIKERDASRATEAAEKLKKEEEVKTEEARQQAEMALRVQEEERRREMYRRAQENEKMMAIINGAALGGSKEIADNIDANIVSRNQYHNKQVILAEKPQPSTEIHETEGSESDGGKDYSSESSDGSVSSPPPQTSTKSWRDYSEVEQRNIIKEIVAAGKNRSPVKAKYGLNNYHIGMIIKKNNDYFKKLSTSR